MEVDPQTEIRIEFYDHQERPLIAGWNGYRTEFTVQRRFITVRIYGRDTASTAGTLT